MARRSPSVRSQARANFEKEEDLAREKKGLSNQPLVLGEYDRKTGKGRDRLIEARSRGPALRGERKRKPKKSDIGY